MSSDDISIIDKKIEELIQDKNDYSFTSLREKVEVILSSVNIFIVDNQVNTKALDMYLKNVITQGNSIKKEQEKAKLDTSKKRKYILIESICKKYEFENQEDLIKKIEELEKKTNSELEEINISI